MDIQLLKASDLRYELLGQWQTEQTGIWVLMSSPL